MTAMSTPIILACAAFLALAGGVFAVVMSLTTPASAVGHRLQGLLGRFLPERHTPAMEDRLERVLDPLASVLPASPEDVSTNRLWLMQAGFREPRHVTMYYGLRVAFVILAAVPLLIFGMFWKNLLLAIALLVLAFLLPRLILKRMIHRRQRRIRLSLPDALDLAVICVEAGLALDQAINRIAVELAYTHPEISDELRLINMEIRAGRSRPEALRNFATRTGVDDVRALVAVLVQTDRFGTSIATALRVQSDGLRTERRQRAEEAAAKTTIKMVPVLALFILPAMFMVILGPAAIGLMRNVLPVVSK